MTKNQEVKLNMSGAVISFSDENTAITDTVPAYGTTLTAFKAKKVEIDDTIQLEAQVISGIAITKKVLKKTLCNTGEVVASGLFAYATSINDPELQEKAKYTANSLLKFKDDQLPSIVQNLHDDANTVIASLTPFGIVAATLTAFQTLITQYSAKVSAPRNATALRKAYGAQLRVLFKEGDTILKTQLDKLAVHFKATEPEFYAAYKNNRALINGPTLSTQAKGTLLNSVNGLPIYNVTITVAGKTYTTTSNLDGTYSLKIPVPGIYTIIFTIDGYQTFQAVNVEVKLGQATSIDVQLIPVP